MFFHDSSVHFFAFWCWIKWIFKVGCEWLTIFRTDYKVKEMEYEEYEVVAGEISRDAYNGGDIID